jgi:predicted MFS family arabinose efflux permease
MFASTLQLYKDAYQGLSRHSWYLSLVMLVNRSGTMVLPFMSIYCTQQLHFTIAQAGVVLSMFGGGSLAGAYVGGRITDKYGFYYVQLGALISGGLLFFVLGLQRSFLSVCITTFILSICNDAFRPANSTAVAHYSTSENLTRSYSLNRLAINLGWAIGGALGGFMASFNYHLLFWVDGCTNILSALLLYKLMPGASATKALITTIGQKKPPQSAYKDGIYLLFLVCTVVFAACFFQLFTMQPVFYKTQWHFSETMIGLLMSVNGLLIIAVEMVLIHKIEGRKHPLIYVGWGILLMGIGFALTNLLPISVWAALLIILFITLGEIFSIPFMNTFWIARTNGNNTGSYAALYSMAWSVAQIIAPILGGEAIARSGYALLWWLLGGLTLLSAAGFTAIYLYWFLSMPNQRCKLVNFLS